MTITQTKPEFLTEALIEVLNNEWKVNAIESGRSLYHQLEMEIGRKYIKVWERLERGDGRDRSAWPRQEPTQPRGPGTGSPSRAIRTRRSGRGGQEGESIRSSPTRSVSGPARRGTAATDAGDGAVGNRAARALAAFEGRTEVSEEDVARVASCCLRHRLRKDPLEQVDSGDRVVKVFCKVFERSESSDRADFELALAA